MDQIIETETESTASLHDKYLRALASLENLRKRTVKDVAAARDQGETAILLELLPVLDDFKRALEWDANPDVSRMQAREGWELVFRKFGAMLDGLGVAAFESVGQKFTADLMEAVSQVPMKALPAGTVIGEVEKGYKRGDRLLRPARVAVSTLAKEESDVEP